MIRFPIFLFPLPLIFTSSHYEVRSTSFLVDSDYSGQTVKTPIHYFVQHNKFDVTSTTTSTSLDDSLHEKASCTTLNLLHPHCRVSAQLRPVVHSALYQNGLKERRRRSKCKDKTRKTESRILSELMRDYASSFELRSLQAESHAWIASSCLVMYDAVTASQASWTLESSPQSRYFFWSHHVSTCAHSFPSLDFFFS